MADEQQDQEPEPKAGRRIPLWLDRYYPLITWVVVTITTALVSGLLGVQFAPVPPPVVVEVERRVVVPEMDEFAAQAPPPGWIADPDEVAAVTDGMTVKTFAATPAGQVDAPLPKSVYGWKAYEQLFARPPPVKNQGEVGSCVSFGTNTAVERTLAAEIVRRKGAASEWARFAEEVTYGGSRVEVGGGRVRGDGSVGAWAAKFVTQWGMVPRKAYPTADLSEYNQSLCRKWGDQGVPNEFENVARLYPIKSTALVKSWAEAKRALAQDYHVAVCSNQGFSRQRDANGVAKPQGSWAHCMALDGYHTEGAKEYGHITNSWGGTYHVGPVGWGNPNPDGFWAEAAVIDRMLRQGDSWAFSGVTGFPKREPLNWFFRAEPRRTGDPFAGLAPKAEALSW